MKKLGEIEQSEQEVSPESEQESTVESPDAVVEKIQDSSEQAIAEGADLLTNVTENTSVEDVEGGASLLEATRDRLSQVGDRIKDLASTTADKLKEVVSGKEIEDMDDEELAEHLKGKRTEHEEAIKHHKALRVHHKLDIGMIRENRAKVKVEELQEERARATEEAEKRDLEILTPQQQEEKATRNKLEKDAFGTKLEDVSDEELTDNLRKKRVDHAEAIKHHKALRVHHKLDIGGIRENRAKVKVKELQEERRLMAEEAEKRGLEVLTLQQQEEKTAMENSSILTRIKLKRMVIRRKDENPRIKQDNREELAELLKEASERGLEVLSTEEQEAIFNDRDKEAEEAKKWQKEEKGIDVSGPPPPEVNENDNESDIEYKAAMTIMQTADFMRHLVREQYAKNGRVNSSIRSLYMDVPGSYKTSMRSIVRADNVYEGKLKEAIREAYNQETHRLDGRNNDERSQKGSYVFNNLDL